MNSLFGKLKNWFRKQWLPLVCLLALACLYIQAMNPDVAGLLYDDGMYLMSGQALWHGQGYSLPLITGAPVFAKYPPLYPAVLGFLDWLTGRFGMMFPGNIPWLKGFNILVSLISLGLLYRWARRSAHLPRWIALGAMLTIGTHWHWIEVSTELMSEPLFFLLTLLTLIFAESLPPEKISLRQLTGLILLSTLVLYARSLGAALILALALWLWFRPDRRASLVYTAACGLLALPWLFWGMMHPVPTEYFGDFLIRSFQETYFQSLKMDLRYEQTLWSLFRQGGSTLINNMAVYFFPLLERFTLLKKNIFFESFPLILSYGLFIVLLWQWRDAIKAKISRPTGIYVGLYFLVLTCWNFVHFFPRFVIMVYPFILIALLGWILTCVKNPIRRQWLIGALLVCNITSNIVYFIPYINKPFPNQLAFNSSIDIWGDCRYIFNYIRTNTPPDSVLYIQNTEESYFYALNTGRKAEDFILFLPKSKLNMNKMSVEQQWYYLQKQRERYMSTIYQLLRRKNVDYFIGLRYAIIKNTTNNRLLILKAPGHFPRDFIPIVTSPHGLIQVYRIDDSVPPQPAG